MSWWYLTKEEIKLKEFGSKYPVISAITCESDNFNSPNNYIVYTDTPTTRKDLRGIGKLEKQLKIKTRIIDLSQKKDDRKKFVLNFIYHQRLSKAS